MAETQYAICYNRDLRKKVCKNCLANSTMQTKICFQSDPKKAIKKDRRQKSLRKFSHDKQSQIGEY